MILGKRGLEQAGQKEGLKQGDFALMEQQVAVMAPVCREHLVENQRQHRLRLSDIPEGAAAAVV